MFEFLASFCASNVPQILDMNCEVRRDGEKRELFLRLNFGDKMQRELTSELKDGKFSGRYSIVCIACTTCSSRI